MPAAARLLVNPRLPAAEHQQLEEMFTQFSQSGETWVASSGSSRSKHESLKLIALPEASIFAAARAVNRYLQASASDSWLQILPSFHVGGMSIGVRAELAHARVVAPPESDFQWSPRRFQDILVAEKISLTSLVPTQVFDLVSQSLKSPGTLRAVLVGGAPLSPKLYLQARNLGWPLLPGYGLTEACALIAGARLESLAKMEWPEFYALDHVTLSLSADDHLQVSGPSLMRGWAQSRDGLSQFHALTGAFTTADLAQIEVRAEGTVLTPLGRHSDFVKINGEGVALEKLRLLLWALAPQMMPMLTILNVSDARSGNALILVAEEALAVADIEALMKKFNAEVAPFERVTRFKQVEKIPRTALGKIEFNSLRALVE